MPVQSALVKIIRSRNLKKIEREKTRRKEGRKFRGDEAAKREGKEEGGRRSRGITPSQRKTWGEEDSDEGE